MGVFSTISGMLKLRKQVAKTEQMKKRAFEGSKSDRLTDFMSSSQSIDADLRTSLKTLRDRCRDLWQNNNYAKKFTALMQTNVIGENGIILQSRAKDPDGTDDENANTIIEKEWFEWTKPENCTVQGKLSFIDCQDLLIATLAVEGEAIIQLVKSAKNPYGFAIKFLDNDQLDEQLNQVASNGNQVRMGVEVDKNDKPVAYWLWDHNPDDNVVTTSHQRKRVRVPASEIIHMFKEIRPGQSRGVPPMSSALLSLKQLAGYIDSELVAARVGSAKMGFFKSPKGDEYQGETQEDGVTPIMNATPGTFEQLPDGMDFQPFDPQHPTSQFNDFNKQILRGISAGLNISYASLSNDLESVNYSSIRQGALEERHTFKKAQRFVIDHFMQRIYEAWLLMSMTTGKIPFPVSKFDKFATPKWQSRGFGYIDPMKETQSNAVGLSNGFLTLQDVAASQGRDVKTIFEQIQKEQALADKFGIKLAFEPYGSKGQFLVDEEEKKDGQS